MAGGRFGEFGGQYVPETLMNECIHLEEMYEHFKNDPEFVKELDDLMRKSGVSDRNMNPTRRQDAVRRVRDNSLERKPPKKDGPTM